ncbi:MAG TPA: dTMP kinase [Clostridiales bacterium]|nr:dTMP kinase [Clostridiales bacterium]
MKKGVLIVFEGIDQSGKGTQSKLFVNKLRAQGYKAEYMHFHDVNTPLGKEIQMFLEGKRHYSSEARQLLFTANRYEKAQYIKSKLDEVDFLIIDRYIPSGLAYGLANGLDLDWMIGLESKLPQPDIVVLIDISTKTSSNRKKENKRDVYEKNLDYLNKVKDAYYHLASKFNYIIVDGEREIELVHEEVWRKVWDKVNVMQSK